MKTTEKNGDIRVRGRRRNESFNDFFPLSLKFHFYWGGMRWFSDKSHTRCSKYYFDFRFIRRWRFTLVSIPNQSTHSKDSHNYIYNCWLNLANECMPSAVDTRHLNVVIIYLRALRSSTTSTCDVIDDWWLIVDLAPPAVRLPVTKLRKEEEKYEK